MQEKADGGKEDDICYAEEERSGERLAGAYDGLALQKLWDGTVYVQCEPCQLCSELR